MQSQLDEMVISIELHVAEQSPDKLQEMVTEPIELALRGLDRVSGYVTATTHCVVEVEVKCSGGASTQDLTDMTDLVQRFQFNAQADVISRQIELRESKLIWD